MTRKPCQYLEVNPDKDGRHRLRKNFVYNCLAPLPDFPPLPASITRSYEWRRFVESPPKTMITISYCADCPVYKGPMK